MVETLANSNSDDTLGRRTLHSHNPWAGRHLLEACLAGHGVPKSRKCIKALHWLCIALHRLSFTSLVLI